MIVLRQKRVPTVPLEAELLSPDVLRDLDNGSICSLTLPYGRRTLKLSEFFDVEGEKSDQILIEGDLTKVKRIGEAMTSGTLTVRGNVGTHTGAKMRGGEVSVQGNAGDWLGAEMKGGYIKVAGDAGDQVAAPYRGTLSGMKNGFIHIGGKAGVEVGLRMRRGTIVVDGEVGAFAGLQMKGGTLILGQGANPRTGAWMRRGTIFSLKSVTPSESFRFTGTYESTFLSVFAKHVAAYGVGLPHQDGQGKYERYLGDQTYSGAGELLVWKSAVEI